MKSFHPDFEQVEFKEKDKFYFYKANGEYDMLNNCNHWTAKAVTLLDIETGFRSNFSSSRLFKEIAESSQDVKKNLTRSDSLIKFLTK